MHALIATSPSASSLWSYVAQTGESARGKVHIIAGTWLQPWVCNCFVFPIERLKARRDGKRDALELQTFLNKSSLLAASQRDFKLIRGLLSESPSQHWIPEIETILEAVNLFHDIKFTSSERLQVDLLALSPLKSSPLPKILPKPRSLLQIHFPWNFSFSELFLSSSDWVTGITRTYPNWNSISANHFGSFSNSQKRQSRKNPTHEKFGWKATSITTRLASALEGMTQSTCQRSAVTSATLISRCTETGRK